MSKKTKLRQLLDNIKSKPKASIEDTLDQEQVSRLQPLAWLIDREKYTPDEIMTVALVHHKRTERAYRAEEILQLIRARQQQKNAK